MHTHARLSAEDRGLANTLGVSHEQKTGSRSMSYRDELRCAL